MGSRAGSTEPGQGAAWQHSVQETSAADQCQLMRDVHNCTVEDTVSATLSGSHAMFVTVWRLFGDQPTASCCAPLCVLCCAAACCALSACLQWWQITASCWWPAGTLTSSRHSTASSSSCCQQQWWHHSSLQVRGWRQSNCCRHHSVPVVCHHNRKLPSRISVAVKQQQQHCDSAHMPFEAYACSNRVASCVRQRHRHPGSHSAYTLSDAPHNAPAHAPSCAGCRQD